MSHVFEHVVKPDITLQKIRNILNSDGVLFIEVPNCENKNILYESINNNPSTFHFSKKSIECLARNNGYRILKSDYFRQPSLFEGAANKIMKMTFKNHKFNLFPYYPKIRTNRHKGTDIRILLTPDKT